MFFQVSTRGQQKDKVEVPTRLEQIRIDLMNFVKKVGHSSHLTEETKLLSTGYIDSFNFVEIMIYIQSKYKIKISPFEVHIQNFDTIRSLSDFIDKKLKDHC